MTSLEMTARLVDGTFLSTIAPATAERPTEKARPRMRKTIIEDEVDIAEMPPVILSPYVTKSSYL
jgi:hypothetical protein